MIDIACVRNKYSKADWPSVQFIEYGSTDLSCDFLVWMSPEVELNYHPDTLIRFRQTEILTTVFEKESYHTDSPYADDVPLGYPKWRDDFFIVRSCPAATKFLSEWSKTGDVSLSAWRCGIRPVTLPPSAIRVHCRDDAFPEIVEGVE